MKEMTWPIQKATPKQRKRIQQLRQELDELAGGESFTQVNPNLPPEVLIQFLEGVLKIERKAQQNS